MSMSKWIGSWVVPAVQCLRCRFVLWASNLGDPVTLWWDMERGSPSPISFLSAGTCFRIRIRSNLIPS